MRNAPRTRNAFTAVVVLSIVTVMVHVLRKNVAAERLLHFFSKIDTLVFQNICCVMCIDFFSLLALKLRRALARQSEF